MQKALITGAYGFLGRHLLQAMSKPYFVQTLGLNSKNDFVTDLGLDQPVLSGVYDVVVHAAALAHNRSSREDDFLKVNYEGTMRLCSALDQLDKTPVHFIYISTVAVYGLQTGELLPETTPLKGSTGYAVSKIFAEEFVMEWCRKRGVACTILRLPLIAGEDPPGNLRRMINAIKRNLFFIPGEGSARKSIVLAEDVASLVVNMKRVGGIYHLTDGSHPSVTALASSIANCYAALPPLHLPLWLFQILAFAGDLSLGLLPFSSRQLNQIKSTLTFDDNAARQILEWRPRAVTDYYQSGANKKGNG